MKNRIQEALSGPAYTPTGDLKTAREELAKRQVRVESSVVNGKTLGLDPVVEDFIKLQAEKSVENLTTGLDKIDDTSPDLVSKVAEETLAAMNLLNDEAKAAHGEKVKNRNRFQELSAKFGNFLSPSGDTKWKRWGVPMIKNIGVGAAVGIGASVLTGGIATPAVMVGLAAFKVYAQKQSMFENSKDQDRSLTFKDGKKRTVLDEVEFTKILEAQKPSTVEEGVRWATEYLTKRNIESSKSRQNRLRGALAVKAAFSVAGMVVGASVHGDTGFGAPSFGTPDMMGMPEVGMSDVSVPDVDLPDWVPDRIEDFFDNPDTDSNTMELTPEQHDQIQEYLNNSSDTSAEDMLENGHEPSDGIIENGSSEIETPELVESLSMELTVDPGAGVTHMLEKALAEAGYTSVTDEQLFGIYNDMVADLITDPQVGADGVLRSDAIFDGATLYWNPDAGEAGEWWIEGTPESATFTEEAANWIAQNGVSDEVSASHEMLTDQVSFDNAKQIGEIVSSHDASVAEALAKAGADLGESPAVEGIVDNALDAQQEAAIQAAYDAAEPQIIEPLGADLAEMNEAAGNAAPDVLEQSYDVINADDTAEALAKAGTNLGESASVDRVVEATQAAYEGDNAFSDGELSGGEVIDYTSAESLQQALEQQSYMVKAGDSLADVLDRAMNDLGYDVPDQNLENFAKDFMESIGSDNMFENELLSLEQDAYSGEYIINSSSNGEVLDTLFSPEAIGILSAVILGGGMAYYGIKRRS